MAHPLRHSGTHWPANAGGEHPNAQYIINRPGSKALVLILADSARYWYGRIKRANPEAIVVQRGLPRPEKLPAKLGWDAKKVAAECVQLWDEWPDGEPNPHIGVEWFTPLNELQFSKESGENWRGFSDMSGKLSRLRPMLRREFSSRGQNVNILFPAWVPGEDLDAFDEWADEAIQWDGIVQHSYYNAGEIRQRHGRLRQSLTERFGERGRTFPILLGEWNAMGTGADEREMLETIAELCVIDPYFMGATYYIWETHNAGEDELSVWGNPERLALFNDPPTIEDAPEQPPAPQPEPEPQPTPEEPPVSKFDPWTYWTADSLASLVQCPIDAVTENWPRLCEQFEHVARQTGEQIFLSRDTLVALAATIAIETAHRFRPIHEFRNADGSIPAYWYTYDGGPEYHGRGFIQNTHRYNYAELSKRIAELWGAGPDDFDFVARPDDLLDPDNSAAAAAIYFRDHGREDGDGIPEAAARGDWRAVRALVQGADAGLQDLIAYATALGGVIVPPVDDTMVYSVNVPDEVILQHNNWSCSVRSTYGALWAMSQVAQGDPVTYGDEGPRDVYEWMVPGLVSDEDGLLDGTGAQLAAMLRSKGYDAQSIYPCTLEQVREWAGKEPVLIGGQVFNHWVYVRGKVSDGGLVLENPSPGHEGITDYLRDSWQRLGPWAAVFIGPSVVVEPPATAPTYDELANLEGNAYHEDGVVIPALLGAKDTGDWGQIDAVVSFLRQNDPHRPK